MRINELDSFSYDNLVKESREFLKKLPENSSWTDLGSSAAGGTVIETLAGLVSFVAYSAYMNRNNSLLDYSTLPTSIMSIGATLGYNFNRRASPIIRLSFDSDIETVWEKKDIFATYAGRSFSLTRNESIKVGSNTVLLVAGEWKTVEIFPSNFKEFYSHRINENVDNNFYELFDKDGNQINILPSIEKLDSSSVMMKSTYSGVSILFGNGVLGYKIDQNSNLDFSFIQPIDELNIEAFDSSKLDLIISGKIRNVEIVSYGADPDSSDKIANISPGYHTSRRLLIGRGDFKYIISAYEGMISGNAEPTMGTCCSFDVVYLKKDGRELTPEEEIKFLKYLSDSALLGTSFHIYPPVRKNVNVKIDVLINNKADQPAITKAISDELNKNCMQLGATFTTATLLHNISNYGVKKIYIQYPIMDKKAKYNEYFVIKSLDVNYLTSEIKELSAGTDIEAGYE